MKKMLYIRPEMVIIPIKVHPLLTGSPFTEGETKNGGGAYNDPDWDYDEEGL
jgi:hypothetical protein